jgi:hypothetical protein
LKSDLKFKIEDRVKRKENITEKIEEEAYLAAAHLADPTSQPTGAQLGIPIRYATGKRDPPKEVIVFHLWINQSSSVSPAPPSLAQKFALPPSSAYKTSSAAV